MLHKGGMLLGEVLIWEKLILVKDVMNKVAKYYFENFIYDDYVGLRGNMQILLDKLQPKSKFGIGESVVENVTAEKANMVPELLMKEKYIVSPVLKGIVKSGGVGIFMTGADMVDAYKKYSGKELIIAESLNLLPVAGAFIGGIFGGGTPISFLAGAGGATIGDIGKYYFLKGRLTDRQKEIDRAVKEFMGNKV